MINFQSVSYLDRKLAEEVSEASVYTQCVYSIMVTMDPQLERTTFCVIVRVAGKN